MDAFHIISSKLIGRPHRQAQRSGMKCSVIEDSFFDVLANGYAAVVATLAALCV